MDMLNGLSVPPTPDKIVELKDVELYIDALNTFLDQMLNKTKQFYATPRSLTTAEIAAINKPTTPDLVFNTTTKKLNFYDGTAWRIVTST